MTTAKVFENGRSQAVRLPKEFRFTKDEVYISKVRDIVMLMPKKGTPIGPLDTLIAAHAKSLELTLVTNNTRDFSRVDGLELEDWVS